ncbi:MAG: hypothetical protein RLW62_15670, partial [Gammaproteobacteria bacterium]
MSDHPCADTQVQEHAECAGDSAAMTRRDMLQRLAALGIGAPAVWAALHAGGADAAHALLGAGEFEDGMQRLLGGEPLPALSHYATFEIVPTDLPWKPLELTVASGQAVTVLLSGRWWLVEELD